jgi:transcriptional regulator with XRE-family HTH domain
LISGVINDAIRTRLDKWPMSLGAYNGRVPSHVDVIPVFGDVVRATRVRLHWTQRRLSRRSGVPQSRISLIERRLASDLRVSEIEALCAALSIEYRVDFRTPDIVARPADLVHARCSAGVSRRLEAMNWRTAREVEVGTGRIRGWIDILAFDERTGTVLVVEIKTEVADFGSIERTIGWYERSAWTAARTLGWGPRRVTSALLVLHTEVNDAAIRSSRSAFRSTFPGTARDLHSVLEGSTTAHGRYLAMIDPASTRRRWLRSSWLEPSRLRAPYRDYVDAVRVLDRARR